MRANKASNLKLRTKINVNLENVIKLLKLWLKKLICIDLCVVLIKHWKIDYY